jgi:hypothetical protein
MIQFNRINLINALYVQVKFEPRAPHLLVKLIPN